MSNGKELRLGADLALTRASAVESGRTLVEADSWGLLDLATGPRRRGVPAGSPGLDLQPIDGRQNLAQALILRLLTPLGDLAHLGHPTFGSRLGELVGRRNDELTRNLARLYTIEAVANEPRVGPLAQLEVRVPVDRPDVVEIAFQVQPIDGREAVSVALEVVL